MDQNEEIIALIQKRMDLGRDRYGHGVRVSDDTRQWGTQANSWAEMALEEVLDGMIYMAAQLTRILEPKLSDGALAQMIETHCSANSPWSLRDLKVPVSQWPLVHFMIQKWNSNASGPGSWDLWPPSGEVRFLLEEDQFGYYGSRV